MSTSRAVLRDPRGREYHIVRRLGRGSYGEVLLANVREAPSTALPFAGDVTRAVAVKLLHRDVGSAAAALQRLRDEARMLAALDHPVILSAHELTTLDGRIALVTEYVDGEDLEARIHGRDPLPRGPVLDVVEQVADALHVAWTEHGIVHRDVKPANIRIGVHGNVKLLDFGIARAELADRAAQTTSGTVLGTLPYLAPERYDLDDIPTQPTSDIFALGCVLYEAWTQTRFFSDLDGPAVLATTDTRDTYEPFLEERLAPGPLHPVADLLRGMLAFDPKDRPRAATVAERCDAVASALPMRQTLRRWARQRRSESGPTQRMSAVAGGIPGLETQADDVTAVTAVTVPEAAALGLAAPLPGQLGVETAPGVTRPSFEPPRATAAVDRTPGPAPLGQPKASAATTRWVAAVVDDTQPVVEAPAPTRAGNWGLALAGTLTLAATGVLLALAYATGVLDVIVP